MNTQTESPRHPKAASKRTLIREALEADPAQTNTAIAKRFGAARDTVIEERRAIAGALVASKYEAMCTAIAECYRSDEVKDMRDKARALEVYTRQAGNREAEQRAIEIRLRAERRAGEIMLKDVKAKGTRSNFAGRDSSGGAIITPPENGAARSFAEQGISKRQAKDWQAVAKVPQEQFEAAVRDPAKRATTAALVKLAKPVPENEEENYPQVRREVLLLYGTICGFERDSLGAKSPSEMFANMLPTMQDKVRPIIPVMCAWLMRMLEKEH